MLREPQSWFDSCHMYCDTDVETEQAPGKIGLRRTWRPVPLIVRLALSCQDNERSLEEESAMLGRVGRRVAVNFSTSPATAAAETIEALQHVSEEERRRAREGRLDRDKVKNIRKLHLIFAFRTWERD